MRGTHTKLYWPIKSTYYFVTNNPQVAIVSGFTYNNPHDFNCWRG